MAVTCQRAQEVQSPTIHSLRGTTETTLAVGEEGGLTRCRCRSDGTLLVLSGSPQKLVAWSLAAGVSLMARSGEGPGELDSRVNLMSQDGTVIFVHSLLPPKTRRYGDGGFDDTIYHEDPIVSLLERDGMAVAAVATPLSVLAENQPGPTIIRLARERKGGREEWVRTGVLDAGGRGLAPDAEFLFRMMCKLVARDQHTFYRVPLWGYGNIEIWSLDGALERTFPIPTRRASQLTDQGLSGPSMDVASGVVLRDAMSDPGGRLHLLAPPDEDGEKHKIIILDVDGDEVQVYEIDIPIACLAIDETGSYIGIADETGQVVRFQTP